MRKAFEPADPKVTVAESVITAGAAGAASAAMLFEVPVGAMFVGWISYFTRGFDLRNGLVNLGCVIMGLVLGVAAALAAELLDGPPDVIELSALVFGVALVVLSLRFLSAFDNLLGCFLGLVVWFVAHQPVSLSALWTLVLAVAIGSSAGWGVHGLQKRLSGS